MGNVQPDQAPLFKGRIWYPVQKSPPGDKNGARPSTSRAVKYFNQTYMVQAIGAGSGLTVQDYPDPRQDQLHAALCDSRDPALGSESAST